MDAMVNENIFGAVNTSDPKTEGFYIVKCTSLSYTLQENFEVYDDLIKEGSHVCEAEYIAVWVKIPYAIRRVLTFGKRNLRTSPAH
eukprot:11500640-Ditylum_brightwellii.AAC.1